MFYINFDNNQLIFDLETQFRFNAIVKTQLHINKTQNPSTILIVVKID